MQRYACIFFAEPMLAAQLSALAHSWEKDCLFTLPRMLVRIASYAYSRLLECGFDAPHSHFATFATFATCHIKHLP